jgi:hypothetical protein
LFLPGDVSIVIGWYNREARRSHSTHRKGVAEYFIGITSGEGLKAILPEIRTGALIFTCWVIESQENL